MPDYGVIGRLTIDCIVTADDRIHEEMLGGATYSAAGARLWSSSVGLLCRVGSDFPTRHLDMLESHGIELSQLQQIERQLPHRTFFAYQDPTERLNGKPTTHFLRLGQPLPKSLLDFDAERGSRGLEELDLEPDSILIEGSSTKGVHLAPLSWRRANLIASRVRERGVPLVTLDPHSNSIRPGEYEQLKTLLHDVDVFMPSVTQTQILFRPNPKDVWDTARTLAAWGPKYIVLTRGEAGQVVYDRENDRGWEVPAYPTQARDVTGAGHAFCGGFLVGLGETGDPLEAALRGSVAASLTVEGTGPFYPLESLGGLAEARLDSLRSACQERTL